MKQKRKKYPRFFVKDSLCWIARGYRKIEVYDNISGSFTKSIYSDVRELLEIKAREVQEAEFVLILY